MPTRKNTPQLPCSVNFGAYPRYTIPTGTNVRVKKLPYGPWRSHVTREDLTFDAVRHSTDSMITFDYDEWRIYVPRRLVTRS